MAGAKTETEPRPVGVLGHHFVDYPRNVAIQSALARAGRQLRLCHSRAPFPLRHVVLAAKMLALPRSVRVVYVTEGGHRLVPWVKLLALLTGRKVVFDPFISRYNTRVEDRRWFAPGGVQAWIAHYQDWSSTHAADLLVFDTPEHRDYFYDRYGLRGPSAIVPVGVPEDLFFPRPERSTAVGDGPTRVLFYGTYIPLQGIETIVDAADLLRSRGDVRFSIVGEGQTRPAVERRVRTLGLESPGLELEDLLPFEQLPSRIARADILLGIFGTTSKAARVVPNKVVQSAAMARPIVTADTPAIRRYFEHETSAYLVPAGDPRALADAVLRLAASPRLRERLGRGARAVFERHFSEAVVVQTLSEVLARLEADDDQVAPPRRAIGRNATR